MRLGVATLVGQRLLGLKVAGRPQSGLPSHHPDAAAACIDWGHG